MDSKHDSKRLKLCLICCSQAKRAIPDSLLNTIDAYLIEGFQRDDPRFGGGLCKTCYQTLLEFRQGKFSRCLPNWFQGYSEMSNFRCKRNGQQCTCILCIRSERIHLYGTSTKRKRGPAPTQIDVRVD